MSVSQPKLIVLCGLPGIGKTTDIVDYRKPGWFIYSTDDYLELVAQSNGTDYNTVFEEYIKHATSYMNRQLSYAIQDRDNMIWDQTNLSRKKRSRILANFPADYYKECWYYPVNARNHKRWQLNLTNRPGKTIPENVLQSMIKSIEVPIESEGFDQIVIKQLL